MLLPRETDGLITKRLCRISVAAPAKKHSTHLKRWADDNDIDLRFIQPAKPSQNAYMERYNRTVRHEWLNQNLFESLNHWSMREKPLPHGCGFITLKDLIQPSVE